MPNGAGADGRPFAPPNSTPGRQWLRAYVLPAPTYRSPSHTILRAAGKSAFQMLASHEADCYAQNGTSSPGISRLSDVGRIARRSVVAKQPAIFDAQTSAALVLDSRVASFPCGWLSNWVGFHEVPRGGELSQQGAAMVNLCATDLFKSRC
jgi:hypothetical protein